MLDRARVDLARTTIRAPIDGVVIKRAVDRGQTVAASLEAPEMFTIAQDLRRMEVHAKIDEADIGRIRVGQRAAFTVDSYPGRSFAGKVIQIRKAHEVVQNVVTYTVLVSAENPDLALLPGMTALSTDSPSCPGLTRASMDHRVKPGDESLRHEDAFIGSLVLYH